MHVAIDIKLNCFYLIRFDYPCSNCMQLKKNKKKRTEILRNFSTVLSFQSGPYNLTVSYLGFTSNDLGRRALTFQDDI